MSGGADSAAPLVTVVIPTRDRPRLVRRALASALAQTEPSLEVVVVDDGSSPPLALDPDPRVRIERHDAPQGVSAARNAGLAAARGRWVTFLDDDDQLLPAMVERAVGAIEASTLPPPRAALCGLDVVDGDGRVVARRVPPSLPRGARFMLEPAPPGRSHATKRTLLAPRATLAEIGGFDPALRMREQSDLMLRLNAVCSIVAVTEVGYRLTRGGGARLSRDARLLDAGFRHFERKHRSVLAARPDAYADVLLGHARMLLVSGPRAAFLPTVARALRVAPGRTARTLLDPRRALAALRARDVSG